MSDAEGLRSRFDLDTAVEVVSDDPWGWRARIDEGWWVERGPNGGFVAAVLARAVEAAVGDPDRPLRSLTVHYLRPPAAGPVALRATIERQGRSMTSVSVRMEQGDRVIALALAACSARREAVSFDDAPPPGVPPPDDLPPPPPGPTIPMGGRYEVRRALGDPPFGGGDHAHSGGWIRLAAPERGTRPHDASTARALLVALTDAWVPPIFSKVRAPLAVPTVDLTVHLRAPLAAPGTAADDWYLVEFRTTSAVDGFLEEDGRVWTRDGTLVAQSRQLAVII